MGEITVILDGKPLTFDVAPQNLNGAVLVPLRAIFEEMGASVEWDGRTQTVTATKDKTIVVLAIGNTSPTIDGQIISIDHPPIIVESRILAPLRFVTEAFGGTVDWVENYQVAIIITSPISRDMIFDKILFDYTFVTGLSKAEADELYLEVCSNELDGSEIAKLLYGDDAHEHSFEDVVMFIQDNYAKLTTNASVEDKKLIDKYYLEYSIQYYEKYSTPADFYFYPNPSYPALSESTGDVFEPEEFSGEK